MRSMLPENISTFEVDKVFLVILVLVGLWFIAAEAVLFYFCFRYRKRDGQKASYIPGRGLKMASWVLVPGALVMFCDLAIDQISSSVWHQIKGEMPRPDLTIKIEAHQFFWQFTHPGKDKNLNTKDDIQTINQLYLPAGKVIRFELSSKDVIHSFFVPALRLKQDAVPGRTMKGWFEATKPGTYPIFCAELCGVGHSLMQAKLHILTPEEHKAWLEKKR